MNYGDSDNKKEKKKRQKVGKYADSAQKLTVHRRFQVYMFIIKFA